ncbi:MAG: hypothetical protein Tsb0010_01050 [Parvularculaceae bacterium]
MTARAPLLIRATSIAVAIARAKSAAIEHCGVLLIGASGAGKSDLALRLIDGCPYGETRLIADDYTTLAFRDGAWRAGAPRGIAGAIEVRGVGIVAAEHISEAPLICVFDLDAVPERMPPSREFHLSGNSNSKTPSAPLFALAPFEASAPSKIRAALRAIRYGLFREFRHDYRNC